MSEELNEQPEALIQDEGTSQEPEQVNTEPAVNIEELQAKAAKAEEYKGFADRVAKENKELKKKLEPQQDLQTNESFPDLEQRLERQDLRIDGYKDNEIDFIMRNGGKTALNDPLVKSAIENQRAKERSKNATPSGTGKSPVLQKYTERDLKSMPLADLEKIIPHADI